MLVEANSPAEAMVKFRCVQQTGPRTPRDRQFVTSVSPADHYPDSMME